MRNTHIELFQLESEAMHLNIINNILEKEQVMKDAIKLFNYLPKNNNDVKQISLPPCEVSIEKLITSSPEISKELSSLWLGILCDYILLFQVFSLLNDTRKDEIFSIIATLIPNTDKFSIQKLCALIMEWFTQANAINGEKSIFVRLALHQYCFCSTKEYDQKSDDFLQKAIRAFFRHAHTPKDLFYTDHEYIIDVLAAEKLVEIYHKEYQTTIYKDPKSIEKFSQEDKNKYYNHFRKLIDALPIWYSLPVIYPKPDFDEKIKEYYTVQKILFDKVLFNKILFEGYYYAHSNYTEPERILEKLKTLDSQKFSRSLWMGCYLLLKEINIDMFKILFGKYSEESYRTREVLAHSFARTIEHTETSDSFKDLAWKKYQQITNMQEPSKVHTKWDASDQNFLQNLLFICMWEKALLYRPDIVALWQMLNTGQIETIEDVEEILSLKELDECFAQCSNIEQIGAVLKEASKKMMMSDEGIDFSSLFNDWEYEEDFLTLLFYLSRREGEGEACLINVINMLREIQLEQLPIYEGKSPKKRLLKENLEKIKKIDIGFSLPHFRHSLYPLDDRYSPLTPNNEGYHIHPITVNFICEVDHCFTEKGKDFREIYKKNLTKKYLYKVRNQITHSSLDDNTYTLLENRNIHDLVIFLFDACSIYKEKVDELCISYEREGILKRMLHQHPADIFTLYHPLNLISRMIQIHCAILAHGSKNLSDDLKHKLIFTLTPSTFEQSLEEAKEIVTNPESKISRHINVDDIIKTKAFIEDFLKLYNQELKEAQHNICTQEEQKSMNFKMSYLSQLIGLRKEVLTKLLSYLFSAENPNPLERPMHDTSFFKYYQAQTSYYLLSIFSKLTTLKNQKNSKK